MQRKGTETQNIYFAASRTTKIMLVGVCVFVVTLKLTDAGPGIGLTNYNQAYNVHCTVLCIPKRYSKILLFPTISYSVCGEANYKIQTT